MKDFTAAQTLQILHQVFPEEIKFNFARLNYYKREKIVEPHGEKAVNFARSRCYTEADVFMLAVVIELRSAGFDVKQLQKQIHKFQRVSRDFTEIVPMTFSFQFKYFTGDLIFNPRLLAGKVKEAMDAVYSEKD